MKTDPISDLSHAHPQRREGAPRASGIPASKLKIEVARILKEEGYIPTYKLVDESKTRKALRVFLKYTPERRSVITDLRASRVPAGAFTWEPPKFAPSWAAWASAS